MGTHGWPFANVDSFPDADVDPINNAEHIRDLYLKADPNYEGRWVLRSNQMWMYPYLSQFQLHRSRSVG